MDFEPMGGSAFSTRHLDALGRYQAWQNSVDAMMSDLQRQSVHQAKKEKLRRHMAAMRADRDLMKKAQGYYQFEAGKTYRVEATIGRPPWTTRAKQKIRNLFFHESEKNG